MPDTDAPDVEANPTLEAPEANPEIGEPTAEAAPTEGAIPANPTASATDDRSLNSQPPSVPAPAATAKPATPPPLDFERQYKALQPEYTRSQQRLKALEAELHRMREGFAGLDPQAARAALERERAQAEAAKLRPWHPKHPDSTKTALRLERFAAFKAAVDALPEAPDKEARVREIARKTGVTMEDFQLSEDHAAYRREVEADMVRDPDAFVESRAERVFERMMAQYEQHQELRAQTQGFMREHQDVISKHADVVAWAIEHPHRRDLGIQLARLMDENQTLKAKLGQQAETVEMAQAQQAATQRRATVGRDARTATAYIDPVEKAQKAGIRPNTNDMARFLIRERAAELGA